MGLQELGSCPRVTENKIFEGHGSRIEDNGE